MPVYVCRPGYDDEEPWKRVLQVFAQPFDLQDDDDQDDGHGTTAPHHSHNDLRVGMVIAPATTVQQEQDEGAADVDDDDDDGPGGIPIPQFDPSAATRTALFPNNNASSATEVANSIAAPATRAAHAATTPPRSASASAAAAATQQQQQQPRQQQPQPPVPPIVRRLRHSEVVIVDDVSVQYNRYWLRLRWPGHNNRSSQFAGYIAMGRYCVLGGNDESNNNNKSAEEDVAAPESPQQGHHAFADLPSPPQQDTTTTGGGGEDYEDQYREETGSMPPSEPYFDQDDPHGGGSGSGDGLGTAMVVTCRRTGLPFVHSVIMKLLPVYDDGVLPNSAVLGPPFIPTEPVFCRICREGLHDDADEEQPTSTVDNEETVEVSGGGGGRRRGSGGSGGDNNNRGHDHDRDPSQDALEDLQRRRRNSDNDNDREQDDYDNEEEEDNDEPAPSNPTAPSTSNNKGPVQPHPTYHNNAEAIQNPMLAPCECAGSMAFVHYLCVEQWRCRSRHPEAADGRNCETCGAPYALPPPQDRPVNVPQQQFQQDDWLDAMPPHVMQALRQPHIWWQIGAAIVRRRWLRPVAPVLMSPIVALYCRARRLLKKRGVARRRWACSLCRRRARWKCVRCLRSYYCSRQCQNVSWHIIHKHVCYKPVRFWWSVVVYGCLTLLLFPGIIRDPLMYDIGFCLIPASFVIMGILGGGVAMVLKETAGIDMRGRLMELAVVLATAWFSVVSWGLVRGFFGDASACYGTLGRVTVSADDLPSTIVLRGLRAAVLQPAQTVYLAWDRLFLSSTGPFLRAAICTHSNSSGGGGDDLDDTVQGCFEHLPNANADFVLTEHQGEKCAADLLLFVSMYVLAGLTFAGTTMWKHHERQRRRQGRRQRQQHPHQD